MKNVIRAKVTMSEEEIEKIKKADWDAYCKESQPPELQGMINCPKCRSILIARGEESRITCYNCGETVSL